MTRAGSKFVVLALLMGAAAQAQSACDLYGLVNARLSLMHNVAAHKWHRQLPIEDVVREARVVENSVQDALRVGLVPATAERFFRAQIAAAKAIQAHWYARWAGGAAVPVAADVPDLVDDIRPLLLALGTQIVRAAQGSASAAAECRVPGAFADAIDVVGVDETSKNQLFSAIVGLRYFADRLEQIRATGQLRVGTTGDYAPFSQRDAVDQAFVGVDIELARDLAIALGVVPKFIPTSWPGLMEDLAAGAFDVAMSGVSLTAERQRVGYFSVPYYSGGKTPIARCSEVGRFASLAAIDQAGVRVIVNPGGTNDRFASEHIRTANLLYHSDNRSIFAEIIQGRADVMITDRIEVQLQSARHPELCSTMAGNLNHQQKAYLLPQDAAFKEYVDAWLEQRLRDTTVAAAFARHGVSLAR